MPWFKVDVNLSAEVVWVSGLLARALDTLISLGWRPGGGQ